MLRKSKSPDVFAWVLTMCKTYSKHIISIDTSRLTRVMEGTWNLILIADDLATHVTVLDILHTKTVANTSTESSIAQSFRR